jgi:hypothetical protein
MTRKECEHIKKILERIKPEDEQVQLGIAYIDKQLAIFNAQRGQMKEHYDSDFGF